MKILFISRAYSKSSGGMERFSYELIDATSSNPSLSVSKITHQGSRKTSPLFALFVMPKALAVARHADYVHIGDPMLSLVGWLIKRVLRKKIIVTVHGLDISYPNFIYQLYLRLFFRSFDLYLPISEAVRKELNQHPVKGKISVINPGISKDYFDQSISRSELFGVISKQEPTPTVFLLTTGRLVKRKGHAWFIANVLPQLPSHIHYIIAGDGPELATIKKAIESYKIQDRVHLLGRVSDSDLKILYNTIDAFIQPNIKVKGDMEGFGLVLLEAALCNKPVFAANLEGMTDAIIPEQNGTLVPAGNSDAWFIAINSFITTPIQIKKARAFTLENYSWQSYINKFAEALKTI